MQTVAVAYGIGNHERFITPDDRVEGMKWNWIGRMVGVFAATFGKNVVIALLLRIQGNTHRRKAWFLHFIWITNTLLSIMIVVVLCSRCRPIELWWNKALDGTCNAIKSSITQLLGTFQGSWMAVSDGVLAIYPMFIFWDLQMSWRRKAGLCALMSGGLIAGVCAALKTVQVQTAYSSGDISYNVYPLLITTLVESWMILILAVIPPLRYLFVKAFEKTKSSISRTAASEYGRSHIPASRGSIRLTDLDHGSNGISAWRKEPSDDTVSHVDNESEEEILPRVKRGSIRDAHGMAELGASSRGLAGITIKREYNVRYESGHEVNIS